MNCLQFDNRIQNLLDLRADPRKDQWLAGHAEQCDECRRRLQFYAAFQEYADRQLAPLATLSPSRSEKVRSAPGRTMRYSAEKAGQAWKLVSVLAAMLLILAGLTVLTPAPGSRVSVASDPGMPRHEMARQNRVLSTETFRQSAFDGLLVARLIPSRMPEWSDFSLDAISLENIDLVALIPEKPASTVRGLPATFQTIAPIYEYSSGLPVVNTLTGSVNYTFNLLKTNWNVQPAPEKPRSENDFGKSPRTADSLLTA